MTDRLSPQNIDLTDHPRQPVIQPERIKIQTYEIARLDCASCARKMADEIASLPEIHSAAIDFATGRLSLDYEPQANLEQIQKKIRQIIHSIEEQAELIDPAERVNKLAWHESLPKVKALRLGAGAILFASALWVFSGLPSLGLYIAAYLILGYDVLLSAYRRIRSGSWFDENFLMSIATLGAFAIQEYPEAVAVMLFYQIGEIAQDMAVNHSRTSIRSLMALKVESAQRIRRASNLDLELSAAETIAPEEIAAGDWLMLLPGNRAPVDGIVLSGETSLDTSALTGESLMRPAGPDSEILAGFVNGEGLVIYQATKPVSNSAVARIMKMVEDASARKAQTELFITRFAAIYTPIMVAIAAALAITGPLITGESWVLWLSRALIVLVISCPCALVLSVPLGYFAGLGAASTRGIINKGGQYLERLASATAIVFDKTGTLTAGDFQVDQIFPLIFTEPETLEMAARIEALSAHPLARSVVGEYERRTGLIPNDSGLEKYVDRPGYGITATLDDQAVALGNDRLLKELQIDLPLLSDRHEKYETGLLLYLVAGNQVTGVLHLSDQLRPEAEPLMAELNRLGVRQQAMLTGDREGPAKLIAQKLGLKDFRHSLLPIDKVAAFEDLQQNSRGGVVFVGDGINDAPVLARADVGIAMGAGRDAALESADVVLLGSDLSKIAAAIRIARKTDGIVRQNVALALSLKSFVLLLALVGLGNIWLAVFADVGVAILAVFNSLRILKS